MPEKNARDLVVGDIITNRGRPAGEVIRVMATGAEIVATLRLASGQEIEWAWLPNNFVGVQVPGDDLTAIRQTMGDPETRRGL